MKRFFAILTFCAAITACNITLLAQSTMPPPRGDYPAHVLSGPPDNLRVRRYILPPSEPRVIKKGPLAPSADDRFAFASFLRDDNTGLIRLLPRESYEREASPMDPMDPVDQDVKSRGRGAFYSFFHLTHSYGYGSDIALDHRNLSVGFAGADYGMLTNLGDTPLEQITSDDLRLQELAAYRPPRDEPKARAEYQRIGAPPGVKFDGLAYQKRLPVMESSTYLLRSISYRRSDVLVAFRVVREDADGSVIIAWKLLKQYPAPALEMKKPDSQ